MVRALARVSVGAIERNTARMRRELAPGAHLCAVVKAEGYGHGAEASARAALRGGASWLAVATAREAAHLRSANVGARMLVMGALSDAELEVALAADADVVAWDLGFLARVGDRRGRVHVKLDTGMGRLGTRDPRQATAVAEAAGGRLAGLMTHFATADELGDAFFGEQLARFADWVAPWRGRAGVVVHAANSAATLRDPAAHFDLVRCGVALYGLDPFQADAGARGLDPALSLRSYVAAVKPCAAGESTGYGRRFVAERDTVLGTLPIGYGDGWRRALSGAADVIVGGERRPLVGAVSMDNVMVDLGPQTDVRVGDEAVLIGGPISAEEVARRCDTINYEITTGIGARVPREHVA